MPCGTLGDWLVRSGYVRDCHSEWFCEHWVSLNGRSNPDPRRVLFVGDEITVGDETNVVSFV